MPGRLLYTTLLFAVLCLRTVCAARTDPAIFVADDRNAATAQVLLCCRAGGFKTNSNKTNSNAMPVSASTTAAATASARGGGGCYPPHDELYFDAVSTYNDAKKTPFKSARDACPDSSTFQCFPVRFCECHFFWKHIR